MKNLIEKMLLFVFIFNLKTKRIMKSTVNGKINYHLKKYAPFVIGFLIGAWALFVYLS